MADIVEIIMIMQSIDCDVSMEQRNREKNRNMSKASRLSSSLSVHVSFFVAIVIFAYVPQVTSLQRSVPQRQASSYLAARLHHSMVSGSNDYYPPDFTILEDNDDEGNNLRSSSSKPETNKLSSVAPETVVDYSMDKQTKKRKDGFSKESFSESASWMDRNLRFAPNDSESSIQPKTSDDDRPVRTFRQDFRGTRVFVQNLPPNTSWQTLKDHFRIAGQVVFASVSNNSDKGHGIVQYETTAEAETAITMMRNHPLNGYTLFVREDVQENTSNKELSREYKHSIPTWKCADPSAAARLDEDTQRVILEIIKARDQARRRRNFSAADAMREDLRDKYGVHIDDRLKFWWVSKDNQVPKSIQEIKGDGRWGEAKPWRQIPTTPEFDACVDPDLVEGLLKQRDIARREKDFSTADSLLQQARNSPDGDLYLRIHDESRTWRIWTDSPPPRPEGQRVRTPAEQCIDIVREYAPDKVDEVGDLLEKFPGREYNILKKLKQRYVK
jgi:RNA recognition motif-containing protein